MFSISCFQYPRPFKTISSNSEFNRIPEPKTNGGFEITPLPAHYIYNVSTWRDWRIDYFSHNPDQIDWHKATNKLLPEPQDTLEIMQRELKYFSYESTTSIVRSFHGLVLSKGSDMEAYIAAIGSEICRVNYYIEETELSSREQQRARSLRKIFSIMREGHKQYISLDFEKGRFEFFNERGEHQGEFYFDGNCSSEPRTDPQHQLHLK